MLSVGDICFDHAFELSFVDLEPLHSLEGMASLQSFPKM